MTSNRPYLLRALYDWIVDNGLTPHVLINADTEDIRIPAHVVRNGKVVLNISPSAVRGLDMSPDYLSCSARFAGQARQLYIPMGSILAIYAQENGQGMMFADERGAAAAEGEDGSGPEGGEDGQSDKPRHPHLQVVK